MSSEALEAAQEIRVVLDDVYGAAVASDTRVHLARAALVALLAEVARLEQERDEAHANTNEGLQWLRDDIAVKVETIAALEAALAVARERAAKAEELHRALAVAREREQRLRDLLGACVKVGFADMPGYTACRGCVLAYEQAGEWWDEEALKRVTHDEDCPLYPFAVARAALVDEPAAATLAEPGGVTGPVEASAIRQPPGPGSASAAADEPGETP